MQYFKNKKFNLISQNIHKKKMHYKQQMMKKHRYLLFFLTKSKKENDKKNNNNFFLLAYNMRAQWFSIKAHFFFHSTTNKNTFINRKKLDYDIGKPISLAGKYSLLINIQQVIDTSALFDAIIMNRELNPSEDNLDFIIKKNNLLHTSTRIEKQNRKFYH